MFKFVVFVAIIAIAAAKPGVLHADPSLIAFRTPTIARVGSYVETIPSAISHQRSTIVHSRANLVTPIITPAIRTIAAPIVQQPWNTEFRSFAAPTTILRSGPVLKYAAAPALTYASAPILRSW